MKFKVGDRVFHKHLNDIMSFTNVNPGAWESATYGIVTSIVNYAYNVGKNIAFDPNGKHYIVKWDSGSELPVPEEHLIKLESPDYILKIILNEKKE